MLHIAAPSGVRVWLLCAVSIMPAVGPLYSEIVNTSEHGVLYFLRGSVPAGFATPTEPRFVSEFFGIHNLKSWQMVTVPPHDFYDTLPRISAGSVVIVQDFELPAQGNSLVAGEDLLLRSPRLWALFNSSVPLVLIIHSDSHCSVRLPHGRTHHVVYRNTWCASQHKEWLHSRAVEAQGGRGWLRDLPFGIAINQGSLTQLENARPPAEERTLLFSFRGTLGLRKPSREAMLLAIQQRSHALQALADRVMVGRVPPHPSGVGWRGRFLVEGRGLAISSALGPLTPRGQPYPSERKGVRCLEMPHPLTTTSTLNLTRTLILTLTRTLTRTLALPLTQVSYLKMLHQSIFTLSPPGDLWETYRTWEAVAAGSLPVVVDNASYRGCTRPAAHLLDRVPGVVVVKSWVELPQVSDCLETSLGGGVLAASPS